MLNLQDYVPLKRAKNKRKTLIISAIIISVIILLFLIIYFVIFTKSKSKKEFLETSIYYVCAAKSKNKKELENMQDDVKNFGGAGKIYQKDEMYYLVLNAYYDKNSADLVAENNKEIYQDVNVLELKTKGVSNKTINKFKKSEVNFRFLKKMNSDLNAILDLQMKYLSGDITENDLCSKLLTLKFDNDDLIYDIKNFEENEFKDLVLNYANLKEIYFSTFFNSFFESDKKSSVICEFVVNLTLLKVDFFNNL